MQEQLKKNQRNATFAKLNLSLGMFRIATFPTALSLPTSFIVL